VSFNSGHPVGSGEFAGLPFVSEVIVNSKLVGADENCDVIASGLEIVNGEKEIIYN
jgi:hypothetical protein